MAFTINLKNARAMFGKTKTRSQMCLVGTEDGRLLPVEIPVRIGCAVDDDRASAWLIDAANQVKDETTNTWYQLVGQRSSVPICPLFEREQFKSHQEENHQEDTASPQGGKTIPREKTTSPLWKLIKGVFHESWVMDLIQMNRRAAEEKRQNMTIIFLGAPVLLAALIIGIKVVKG